MLVKRLVAAISNVWDHLDPKVKYAALTYVVSFAVTHFALDLDPEVGQAINFLISLVTGYSVTGKAKPA